jgi:hypothetical protein
MPKISFKQSPEKETLTSKAYMRNVGKGEVEYTAQTIKFYLEKGRFSKERTLAKEVPLADVEETVLDDKELAVTAKEVTYRYVLDNRQVAQAMHEKLTEFLKVGKQPAMAAEPVVPVEPTPEEPVAPPVEATLPPEEEKIPSPPPEAQEEAQPIQEPAVEQSIPEPPEPVPSVASEVLPSQEVPTPAEVQVETASEAPVATEPQVPETPEQPPAPSVSTEELSAQETPVTEQTVQEEKPEVPEELPKTETKEIPPPAPEQTSVAAEPIPEQTLSPVAEEKKVPEAPAQSQETPQTAEASSAAMQEQVVQEPPQAQKTVAQPEQPPATESPSSVFVPQIEPKTQVVVAREVLVEPPKNEAKRTLGLALPVVDLLFDVLRGMHGRVDWRRMADLVKAAEKSSKALGKTVGGQKLDFSPLTLALKEHNVEAVPKQSYRLLETLYEHFTSLNSEDAQQAKTIIQLYYWVNDVALAAVVEDDDVNQQVAQLQALATKLSMDEGLSALGDAFKSINGLRVVDEKLLGFKECLEAFKRQTETSA